MVIIREFKITQRVGYCFVTVPDEVSTADLRTPDVISRYSITEITLNRWIPEKTRD